MGKFINPFTDWGFKKIFGQEVTKDILITFLNSLLEGEHVITDLTFLDKEQLSETKDMRGIIYDVYCTTDKGERIIVEMQNRDQTHFIDRTTFYIAKAIANQGQKGSWDYELDAVYGVFFMNFKSMELDNDKLRTDIVLSDKETHKMFTNKVRMIYLQLPCFTKSEAECNTLFDCFIYTLKNMEILDRMPFMAKNAVFKKLAEIADVNTLTQEEHEKYDSSIKVLRDNIAVYQGAIREGEIKGIEEGIKTGLAKGRQEGRIETIKMLLASGMPIEQIATALNVDIEELKALIV
ncbi:MAG: Rpn family recombination-promoting nuclease/putative transposase [Prevotella sp.]|nr:Rpn family recombination-promoting nuclease/putative transposase [Prevotella sp.]